MQEVIIATIAAVPPTIAAIAALVQVKKLKNPIDEVNKAVNHRKQGQRRLVEMVDEIYDEVHGIRSDLERHQAWHQLIEEERED